MNVLVLEVLDKWVTGVLISMSVWSKQAYVLDQVLARILMEASNVFVQEVTSWMRLVPFVKTEMNVKKILLDVKHQNAETLLDLTSNISFFFNIFFFNFYCIFFFNFLRCGCPDGFNLHNAYQECVDANECLDSQQSDGNSVCGSAKCQNSFGSFSCLCPSGYSYNNNLQVCIQSASGCGEAECAFGCNALGSTGFECQCPKGHQVT